MYSKTCIALFLLASIATPMIHGSEKKPTITHHKPAHQEIHKHTHTHASSPLSYRDEYNEDGCLRSFRGPIVCTCIILLVAGSIGTSYYLATSK